MTVFTAVSVNGRCQIKRMWKKATNIPIYKALIVMHFQSLILETKLTFYCCLPYLQLYSQFSI